MSPEGAGALLSFWGVQTWDVWDAGDRYPDAAVPSLADAR